MSANGRDCRTLGACKGSSRAGAVAGAPPMFKQEGSPVSKRLKTAAELVALLNAELRKHDACAGVSVDGISPVADDTVDHTWTASVLRKSAGPVPGQCSRIYLAAVRVLQQQYDLASEE